MRKKGFLLTVLFFAALTQAKAQFYSVRINLVGLATTNINVEASMTINRKWSLHVPIQYNPFKFSENKQFRNFYFTPGVRYWFLESYNSTFLGIHTVGAKYSIGNLFGSKHRYEGTAYGAGISVGRAYTIGKSWNIELEAGVGAAWLDYDKYICKRCGDLVEHKKEVRILPTKAAINLVYLF